MVINGPELFHAFLQLLSQSINFEFEFVAKHTVTSLPTVLFVF